MVKSRVEAAVFVQCLNSCPEEVAWVASLAQKHKFIKGIVAGLDLTQDGDTLRWPGWRRWPKSTSSSRGSSLGLTLHRT